MKNTPQTNTILTGLKQLPTIATDTAESLARKVQRAEIALIEAQEKFNEALRGLADDITEDGDGWTVDEIWATDLRGNAEIMQRVRANKGE